MSCSASSNLRSQLIAQTINVTSSGTRISFNIDTSGNGYTIGSGITAGSVVRYDPSVYSYVLSSAAKADTAEVIGVVEKYFSSNGATVFTVVANGLMNYPDLSSIPDLYKPGQSCVSESYGGLNEGGKDIFFLSDGCTGSLQLIEPTTPGAIVKPVIQALNVPGYNSIVLNYIGYEVGDQAQAEFPIDGLLGSIIYVMSPISTVPNGYIDISIQREVSVNEYPDLYEILGTNFGYYQETITLNTTNTILATPGDTVEQYNEGTLYNSGTIILVDQVFKRIVVEKLYSQLHTNDEYQIAVNGTQYGISNSEVSKFTIPSTNSQIKSFRTDENEASVTMVPLLKAKNNLSFVSVVQNLSLQGLTMDGRDVAATLDYLCASGGCP